MARDFYCDEALSGRTAVEKVLETDSVLAFHHTRPHWPVHIVVVPKTHITSLLELDDDGLALELLQAVRDVAAEITAAAGGCHIVTNLGKYQESTHLHFHAGAGEPKPNTHP